MQPNANEIGANEIGANEIDANEKRCIKLIF
jgi:hypothetical protein